MKIAVLSLLIVAIALCISIRMAEYTYDTDFIAYYRTAKIITDPNTSNIEIYTYNPDANHYDQPGGFIEYVYSMIVAYLMAPLAYLSYYNAKALLIFMNFLSYIGAVAISLSLLGASGRWFYYPLVASMLWLPFLQDIRFAQINSIIFLLVMVGIYFAVKNRPAICGAFIGFACLFKLFPFAIALVLGIKNWRVMLGFAVMFGPALLLPGTSEWLTSIILRQPFWGLLYSPVLQYLGHKGFTVFVVFIAGITAYTAFRSREADYITLACLAIPAMFLALPIVECHHLVLIVLPLFNLLFSKFYWLIVLCIPLVIASGWFTIIGLFFLLGISILKQKHLTYDKVSIL